MNTLTPRQEDEAEIIVSPPATTDVASNGENGQPAISDSEGPVGSQACSTCRLTFTNVQDQRSHLRSDLHNYNLKQKLRGHPPTTEIEFEKLIGDLDESLSGSDSSETDEDEEGRKDTTLTALLKKQANLSLSSGKSTNDQDDEASLSASTKNPKTSGKPPLLWFSSSLLPANTYFGIYRSMFTTEDLSQETNIVDKVKASQLQPMPVPKPDASGRYPPSVYQSPHIFLCMIGGGHFAAMIVSLPPRQTKHGQHSGPLNREATVLHHKTFHRYTTRRKQGGSQSANDNAKGKAHSAGSNIRRANEQALITDVRALLIEWKDLIDSSEHLFIRASGIGNRRVLYDDHPGRVLRANDPRIKGFPFNTRRATQNELMRSFIELTRLKVQEITPVDKTESKPAVAATTSKPAKPAAPKLTEEEETALLHTSQLQAFIRRSKLPALLSYLQNNSLSPDFRFQPEDQPQNHHAPTALHLAASMNSATLVTGLIVKGGADPTTQNREGKTAFELAGDRSTRDAFRVARDEAGEDRCDWDGGARVPPAMKRAEAEQRDQREKAEAGRKEAERRAAEEERLKRQGPKVAADKPGRGGPGMLDRTVNMSAQDRREEEARGMTPALRARLERERRARAAEERMKRMAGGQ